MSTLELSPFFWPIISLLIIIAIKLALDSFFKENKKAVSLSVYEKRTFLFDNQSELTLYKILLELFADKYFIFPQIHYIHLVDVPKGEWKEKQKSLNRINRKSADFVFCDKEKVSPLLVIELDGSSHNLKRKQERDQFIDELMQTVGLPILHLNPKDLQIEIIRAEIEKKLNIDE